MDKIFPQDWHFIVKEIIQPEDLMEIYPMLSTEDQVANIEKNLFGKSGWHFDQMGKG